MKYLLMQFTEQHFNLDGEFHLCICIQNPSFLYNFLKYMNSEFSGDKNYLSVIEDGKILNIEREIFFIPDIFDLDINSKKNISALFKILKSSYSEKINDCITSIQENLNSALKEISIDFPLELTYASEINCMDIFKMVDMKFNEEADDKVDIFIKYLFIINELFGIYIFAVNLFHSFFDQKEINSIYEEIKYKHIVIISIDNQKTDYNDKEKIILIDNDLCVL